MHLGSPALYLYCAAAIKGGLNQASARALFREYGGEISNEMFGYFWNKALNAPGIFGVWGVSKNGA